MKFDFNIYSSFLLVFFVHIMVYAFMLWRRGIKQERFSDKLLGTFLFLAALYVVPWMTGFAGWYRPNTIYREILFYTPFIHGLFIGPLVYFYVKSLTNYRFQFQKKDWLHFVPGFAYLLLCGVIVVVDKVVLKRYYLMDGNSDPDFDDWYQWLQNISIIIYLLLSISFYKKYKQYAFYEFSFADLANLSWLRNFIIAFGIITVLPLLQGLLQLVPAFSNLNYVGSWYYFFSFAIVVYYIAINGFSAVLVPLRKLLFEPELLLQYYQPKLLTAPQVKTEEAEFEILGSQTSSGLEEWMQTITTLMQNEKLYEDAELTLSQLAKKLSINTSLLSKIINTGFKMNFNDFVNEYRVNAMMEKLVAGEQKKQTLLGLAFDCGFNSKATFNRAFKKQTGLSPKEWIEQNA